MTDLNVLEDWAAPLLQRLEPAARTKLAKTLAQQVRRSQQQRITAQRNPDGTAFAPRKPRLRDKTGRVRGKAKMFRRLKTASMMKARGNASGLTVGFTGRLARIARVHQYGLHDAARPGSKSVKYARREILGWTPHDFSLLREQLLNHLTNSA
ncbi:phage virion morphogenesis protein [Pseudomonas entomophila]|uniref:phage virion morphogenesis protein n=1 Tax=Pseudomonas entomophila TaxID=312306 RepID=UPI0015E30F7B|nr:phage virion morphogenesis protein [Pseudomonas entomophila]MBA1187565.1 phage virion morphogenesis protein [Pseudomonas entomophila]